jgi:hypothetical protein
MVDGIKIGGCHCLRTRNISSSGGQVERGQVAAATRHFAPAAASVRHTSAALKSAAQDAPDRVRRLRCVGDWLQLLLRPVATKYGQDFL